MFENKAIESNGLAYNNATIGDLVNKDTDLDGIPDWEEALWGTDPTKKETASEIPDSVAIEKLKIQQEAGANGQIGAGKEDTTNLTQTDKFSREFLATVATLNQNGAMDQATVDKLSSSLADQIKNSPQKKVFLLSNLKIINDDTSQSIKNYNNTLNSIFQKNSPKYTVMDVLQKFVADENNVDISVLSELDPIIKQTNNIINGTLKMEVPSSLATLHLHMINGLERIMENLNDIKLFDTDVIVALSGISKYETNATALELVAQKLTTTINQKLKQ